MRLNRDSPETWKKQEVIDQDRNRELIRGIGVYRTSYIWPGSGICLPGIGIFIHKKVTGVHFDRMVQHEYGHFLDFQSGFGGDRKKILGSYLLGFYVLIGLPSLLNLIPGFRWFSAFRGEHRTFWTELRANRLAGEYFGNQLAPDFYRYFPLDNPKSRHN